MLSLLPILLACKENENYNSDINEESNDNDSDNTNTDNSNETISDNESQGLSYSLDETGSYYTVTGIGSFGGENLNIPNQHERLPVKEIDMRAFEDCTKLKSIVIPENIGSGAFYNCTQIENIFFNAQAIKDFSKSNYIFYNVVIDNKGIRFTVDKNCSAIPDFVFYQSSANVKEIIFDAESSCKRIGHYAFTSSQLSQITIPESIVSLGEKAFAYCKSVKTIYFNAENMMNLSYDTLPFAQTGEYGAHIVIGKSVCVIPNYLFAQGTYESALQYENGDNGIVKVSFEENSKCETIGDKAFFSCLHLKFVELTYRLSKIGRDAFRDCDSIIEVINFSILDVKSFFKNAIHGNISPKVSIQGDYANSELYETDDGFVFWKNETQCFLVDYTGTSQEITLPNNFNGVNYEIYPCAFTNKNVKTVYIPDTVTVNTYAFLCTVISIQETTDRFF